MELNDHTKGELADMLCYFSNLCSLITKREI